MIQDISPHKFSNIFIPSAGINDDDYVLHYNGNSLLLKIEGDEFRLPQKKDFPEITGKTEKTFLFSLDDVPCFLVWDNLNASKPELVYKEINFFRTVSQREIAWISIAGFHLMNWYLHNKYCGNCGTATEQKTDERAIICPSCKTVFYPKISPAVIVAITCGNKMLLARNSNFPGQWYSLIAGYVDIGESLEECLIREVKEEVGLDIKNIRYYKSQPWPFSGSLMIGFIAEADDKQAVCIDNKEIAEAAWFTKGNLPNHPSNISIAGEMIEKFENGEL
jgi:NAD+ diphosphatase